jgi:small subunit ribosomal protein S13
MSSFLNTNSNDKRSVKQALSGLFGIGRFLSERLCRDLGLNPLLSFHSLSTKQATLLEDGIKKNLANSSQEELSRSLYEDVRKLYLMRSLKGQRHKLGLPLRGQRTRTNGKTAKRHNRLLTHLKW